MVFKTKNRLIIKLSILFVFCSCETDMVRIQQVTQNQNLPQETAYNIDIIYSENAILQARLKSPQLDRYESDNSYFELPKGMKITFYDNNKEQQSELTANYGVSYEKKEIMEARENVVVVNKKGEILNTEHLIWDKAKEKILSDEFVKITTKDEIIFGDSFEANQDFSRYKIFKIKGTINLQNNDSTETN